MTVLLAAQAQAHPSDEIIQQAYLTPTSDGVTIQLDLTPGVLVAPRFSAELDINGDGRLDAGEVDTHAAAVRSALHAKADDKPLTLTLTDRRYPPLELLRAGGGVITVVLTAPLPAGAGTVTFTDNYEPGTTSTVQMSVLTGIPPLDLGPITRADSGRTIGIVLRPDTGAATRGGIDTAPPSAPPSGSSMLEALRRPLTSPWALLALLGACTLLGALHALTPGHGKALLAAYLVGEQSQPKHAIALGVVITFTHTATVLALGGAVLLLGGRILPSFVVPVLTIVSGALVLGLGTRLLLTRWRDARSPGHHHGHGHGHGATSLRELATMGVSAGMIPCPEALSVMLLAIGLNRTALGILMIVAFSIGLAAVLVGLGLVLVAGAPAAARLTRTRPHWMTVRVPLISAFVVTVLGGTITVIGLTSLAG
ncbi:HoxN/HupN/NixA family nickel/cobalt transporter [Allokutzneria albata]|uniref:Nickel/cobalt efflux system n=1 Tax=Allokutzneria albata TaxID=211114 RepID=A0A1G9TUZ4_ALLAB|nr:hypothetical protein [Allokutzneria albata]SDM51546.1 ABC-type nickel/cobalt efflux system, permease component RcnA [Allokutzneria albata]